MDLALWGIFSGLILVPGSIDVGGYCWLDLLSRRDLSSLSCLIVGLAGSDLQQGLTCYFGIQQEVGVASSISKGQGVRCFTAVCKSGVVVHPGI